MKRSTWKKSVVVLLVALLALLAACEQTNNPSGDVTGNQSSEFCNVVFDTNGGSTIPTQQVEKNSIIQPPKTERTGYTFAGWSYDFSSPIQEDVHAVASWTPNTYKITYLPNGGTLDEQKQEVTFDKPFTLKTPTREAYYFGGWYIDDVPFTDQGVWSHTKDLTLQAKWEEMPCFIVENGTIVRIASFAKDRQTYTIPEMINGERIIAIGSGVFQNRKDLTSITIPDSVTSIGNYAFGGCTGLTSISIPSSVTSIGNYAFCGCTGLTSITIPNSVTSIDAAFEGCTGLNSITIPNSVTSIGNSVFNGCSGLTSFTIPSRVTRIGSSVFIGCSSLTSITIPSNVIDINRGSFADCSSLISITVDQDNPVYHASGNCLIQTKEKILILGCKNSVIPSDGSVTSIGAHAFSGCTGLTSIVIPDSVTSIDAFAFNDCTGLTSIVIPNSITYIDFYSFGNCSNLTNIQFNGTKAQWQAIAKNSFWDINTGSYTVHCTDGDI